MQQDAVIGKNRTGIALSPIDSREMTELDGLKSGETGDENMISFARAEYVRDAERIGSVPPPTSVKGVAATAAAVFRGVNANALIDKLGERLAFERTGTRLYAALADKCAVSEELAAGPTEADLRSIEQDELSHFHLVRNAMLSLGGDPTAVTPSADVQSLASSGLLQVVGDPRMTVKQSLEAVLVAELVDNDCWSTLVHLCRSAGHEQMAVDFEDALRTEELHLERVRAWVREANFAVENPIGH